VSERREAQARRRVRETSEHGRQGDLGNVAAPMEAVE
jgi:hypothetical protein